MGLGFLYAGAANVNVNKSGFLRKVVTAGALLALPFVGKAQTKPTFVVLDNSITSNVCQNDTIFLNSLLNASDIDAGQTLTWSVIQPPNHGGTIYGLPTQEFSGSSNIPVTASVFYVPGPDSTGSEYFQLGVTDDVDGASFLTISVNVNGKPRVSLGAFPSVCTGTTSASLPYTGVVANTGPQTAVFRAFPFPQPFVVPTGVTTVDFVMKGARGGQYTGDPLTPAGSGGCVSGTIAVTSGQLLYMSTGIVGDSSINHNNAFGGGGNAFTDIVSGDYGGTGGGSSDIRIGGKAVTNRVAIAGGGGGNGWDPVLGTLIGGDGGYTATAGAANANASSAGGANQFIAGAGATYPPFAPGGNGALFGYGGGDGSTDGVSGGGGGGWYGGGGGVSSGGGGGSSHVNPLFVTGATYTTGCNQGSGEIAVTYPTIGTYDIDYDATANTFGFADVPVTFPIPTSPFPITIPAGCPAGIYNATLHISNGICDTSYKFTVEVKQTPEVAPVAPLTVCNTSAALVTFTPAIGTSPVYNWNNDNTSIGALSSGTGNVSFVATNTGTAPIVATFTVTPVEFGCSGTPVSFTITSNPQPDFTLGTMPAPVCQGNTTVSIPFSNLVNVGPVSTTFNYLSGNTLPQVFTIPANVTMIHFDVRGGIGGSDDVSAAPNPGKGARVEGDLNVNPTDNLNIYVGGRGFNGSPFGSAGGYNGGGDGLYFPGIGCGGAGGGASDIRVNGTALSDRAVVAGGGGGNGWDNPFGAYAGGNGGGLIGGSSAANNNGNSAGGGTQIAGGNGATYTALIPGANGTLGNGGNGSPQGVSGGGGGGYFGGGGGVWTGGGGGSSYADPVTATLVTHTPGFNIGDGSVTIDYATVGTYTINWGVSAIGNGFTNVSGQTLDTVRKKIDIVVPAIATPSPFPYTGTLTLDNGLCTKTFPISILVNPLPDVTATPPGNQSICNGDTSLPVDLNGSLATTKFYWVSDMPSIGIDNDSALSFPATIPSFTAVNISIATVMANVTITPVETVTGCVGVPIALTYSVNPTPHLSSALTSTNCSNLSVNYTPTSATASTSFTWKRSSVLNITNAPASATGTITEALVSTSPAPVTVPYVFALAAKGCKDTEIVSVTIKPTPILNGLLRDTLCSGQAFRNALIETSLTSGVTYDWTHNEPIGSTVPAAAGSGPVTDIMGNISPNWIAVNYNFHLTANGCINDQTVTVQVKPIPKLNSIKSFSVCSGQLVSYHATSATPGVLVPTDFMWDRVSIPGITPATSTNNNDINETLFNGTDLPIVVPYTYHLSADGCVAPADTVSVTVNPIPRLTSTHDTAICSGVAFTYTATSVTPGATFTWIRTITPGLSNGSGSGFGNVNETYTDTTTHSVKVAYWFTVNYMSCTRKDTVTNTINPIPKFTAKLDTLIRCDSSNAPTYVPTSSTTGATFPWKRPLVVGINNPAATGSGNLTEMLKNTTNFSIYVPYTYVVAANGCIGDTVTKTLLIHPTATLSSDLTPHYVCTDVPFHYEAASYVTGATFNWDRFAVKGVYTDTIGNPNRRYYATSFGTGNVDEVIFDTDYAVHPVVYLYRVTANGCTNLQKYPVTVNVVPGPRLPGITTNTPLAPCSNTQFQTFAAGAAPASGVQFDWFAHNATVWSSTADHKSIYVNFNFSGMSYIRLRGTTLANGCTTNDSVFVNVGTGVSDGNVKLVHYQDQFVCLRSDMDTYQWGYDDIATFTSVTISGATQQNVYLPGADMQRYRYWVITTLHGCTQKTYYNSPLGVNEVNADIADIKVYPNPTKDNINVEINSSIEGKMHVELINLLGQKLNTVDAVNHKATIDVSNLPGGCYLVDCYRDGVKIATSRFIKN